jgi:RsmE family RNA methyltransferase
VNLILLEPFEVDRAGDVRVTGLRADHMRRVLHVAPGQALRVGVVDGPRGVGTVQAVSDHAVTLRCAWAAQVPQRPPVDLLLALPRPKVLRRLLPQVAAMGVGRILLTNAGRVERDYFDTHVLAPAFLRGLLIEGLQQAQDTLVPEVSIHRRFRPLIEDELDAPYGGGTRLLADPGARQTIGAAMDARPGARVLLAVGPEGGWSDFERDLLEANGFIRVALGARTLRTDTACVALLALVHVAYTDPGSATSSHS